MTVSDTEHRSFDLHQLEGTAAMGYLYNAIAHELNNQLTNLLLAADRYSIEERARAIEVMLDQAQKIGEVVRRMQEMGLANMDRGSDRFAIDALCGEAALWLSETRGADEGAVSHDGEADGVVVAHRSNLLRALCLLGRWGDPDLLALPLRLSSGIEELPRSNWAPEGETVSMAVIRIRRGEPPDDPNPLLEQVVNDFFGQQRSPEDVALMAAWEIVRKVRGRLQLRGGPGGSGLEWMLALQLAE